MKKQLLMVAIAAGVVGSAKALVNDRTVTNQTDYVIFVAWKNMVGSKSAYQRLMPGETYTFGATERGYGVTGAYGNTIQVEVGQRIGKSGIDAYKTKANSQNKKLDPAKEAFVREKGDYIEVLTSQEIAAQ